MVYALGVGAVACATAICFCNHPHVSGCVQMLDDIGEGYLSVMLQYADYLNKLPAYVGCASSARLTMLRQQLSTRKQRDAFPPDFVSLATLRVVFHVTQIVYTYSRIRDPVFSGESVTEPPNLA